MNVHVIKQVVFQSGDHGLISGYSSLHAKVSMDKILNLSCECWKADKSVPLFVLFLPLFLMPGSSLVDYNLSHVFSFLLRSLLVISMKTFTSSALLPPLPFVQCHCLQTRHHSRPHIIHWSKSPLPSTHLHYLHRYVIWTIFHSS